MGWCAECGKETDELDWGTINGQPKGYCLECIDYHVVFQTSIFTKKWQTPPKFVEEYIKDLKTKKAMVRA